MIKAEIIRELQTPEMIALKEAFFQHNGFFLPYNINEFDGVESYRETLKRGVKEGCVARLKDDR